MGGLFEYIAQACQSLAATAAPSITAMGIHIVIALATIMMVWFGVQEALASAHGEGGFSMARFLNLFMLLTFAYAMVNYYDSSIPGLGFSIKSFIDGGTTNLIYGVNFRLSGPFVIFSARPLAGAVPLSVTFTNRTIGA